MELLVPVTPPDLFESGRFGLYDAVNWFPGPNHWAGGIQYDADCTESNVIISPCVSGAPSGITKSATWSRTTRGSRPFTIYDEADCSAVGDWWTEGKTKVLRALGQSGPTQVERTFWTGASGGAPHVIYPNIMSTGPVLDETGRITLQPSGTAISGVPLDVTEGLNRLEATFGDCYDGIGWVHVPSGLINSLCARGLVYLDKNNSNILRTWAGNRVIIGRGYSLTAGPGGTTPPGGSTWMWMTSPVFGIRGPVRNFEPIQSFDRGVNTAKFIAEQTHVLGWTCCRVGVLVTTGGEQAGEPSAPTQDT